MLANEVLHIFGILSWATFHVVVVQNMKNGRPVN